MIPLLSILACIPVEWTLIPTLPQEERPEEHYSWRMTETYQAKIENAKIIVGVEAANTYLVLVMTKLGSRWERFRHVDEIPFGVRRVFGEIVNAALQEHRPETVFSIVPPWAERSVVDYLDQETSRSQQTWRMIQDSLGNKLSQGDSSRQSFKTLLLMHTGPGPVKANLERQLWGEQWVKTQMLRDELAKAEELLTQAAKEGAF